MPWQLCCHGMCKIVTWSESYFSHQTTCIFTRFGLWAHTWFAKMGPCCLYSWVTCQNMSRLHLYTMKVCKHIWNTKTVIKYRGNFYWTCAFKVCKHMFKVLFSTIQKLKIFAIIITHGSANRRQVVNPWHQTLQGQLMQHLGNIQNIPSWACLFDIMEVYGKKSCSQLKWWIQFYWHTFWNVYYQYMESDYLIWNKQIFFSM